jgi:hypothetical protein
VVCLCLCLCRRLARLLYTSSGKLPEQRRRQCENGETVSDVREDRGRGQHSGVPAYYKKAVASQWWFDCLSSRRPDALGQISWFLRVDLASSRINNRPPQSELLHRPSRDHAVPVYHLGRARSTLEPVTLLSDVYYCSSTVLSTVQYCLSVAVTPLLGRCRSSHSRTLADGDSC